MSLQCTASAHILYMTSRQSSSASCADFRTDYIELNGKCLLLHYQWLYGGTLQIFLQDEQQAMELVTTVVSSDKQQVGQWHPLFVTLPVRPGLHQVVIRATRTGLSSGGNSITGLAIDDLSVRYCTDYSKFSRLVCINLHTHQRTNIN